MWNFKFANPANARWLLPPWTVEYLSFSAIFEKLLRESPKFRDLDPLAALPFWCEMSMATGGVTLVEPQGDIDLCGNLIIQGDSYQIALPLNPFYRAHPIIEGKFSLYLHSIQTDVPLPYVGITRRKWFTRLSEHQAAAASGSRYFFHSGLREHQDKNILHRVLFTDLNEETAMQMEEEAVREWSLYPLGLNMIPGGYAGLKYLSTFGVKRRTTDGVDAEIRQLMSRESIKGRPNPLCSARWQSDPDYAERVICGHSGRLTAEEVRKVRNLRLTGRTIADIAGMIGRGIKQIERVWRGLTYSRIS